MRVAYYLALVASVAGAFAAPPIVPGDVRDAVQERVDFGYTPGVVIGVINADGRTTWSYGARSWEDATMPDSTTIYEIASVTKTFTASLLSQMVEAGDVALDDLVSLHLPPSVQMPADGGEQITLEDLATHYSGLPTATPFPECLLFDPENSLAGYEAQEIYDFLAGHTLPRAPGAAFEYSNLGIGLLGHALAYSQGMTYEAILKERVLDPLGMTDTAITLTPEQEARRVPGHGGFVPRPRFVMDELAPAGGLASTVDDLLTYLEHHMGLVADGPLNDALAATHFQRAANPPIGGGIGLAWWRWNLGGGVVQHGGDSIGSAAFIGFRPSTGVGAVVVSNSRRHENAELRDLGFRCLGVIPNVLPTTAPATVPLADQEKYVGRYELAGTELGIGLYRDQLTLISNGIEVTLYARGGRRFTYFDSAGNADFTFIVDSDGESTGATLNQLGQSFPLTRVIGPLQFEAVRVCDEIELRLRAEPLMTYTLEASDDGLSWTAVGEASIRGARYREPIGDGTRLFRLVE
jgi:CubicO group peptidase (beta-lactamase class C family)